MCPRPLYGRTDFRQHECCVADRSLCGYFSVRLSRARYKRTGPRRLPGRRQAKVCESLSPRPRSLAAAFGPERRFGSRIHVHVCRPERQAIWVMSSGPTVLDKGALNGFMKDVAPGHDTFIVPLPNALARCGAPSSAWSKTRFRRASCAASSAKATPSSGAPTGTAKSSPDCSCRVPLRSHEPTKCSQRNQTRGKVSDLAPPKSAPFFGRLRFWLLLVPHAGVSITPRGMHPGHHVSRRASATQYEEDLLAHASLSHQRISAKALARKHGRGKTT
jgi:hypothetical protein